MTNPVHDHIILVAGTNLHAVFNYHINAITGQPVHEGELSLHNGGQYELPLKENLKKGIYTMISLISNNPLPISL